MLEAKDVSSSELIKPFYEGKDLSKWYSPNIEKFIIFTRRGTDIDEYPAIKEYLGQYRERLTPRNSPEIKIGYKWFEIQDAVDYFEIFEKPKISRLSHNILSKFRYLS